MILVPLAGMFFFIYFLLPAGVVRRQAALGSRGVRRGGRDLRPLGDHLAAGYHPLQQVSYIEAVECLLCSLESTVLYSVIVNIVVNSK